MIERFVIFSDNWTIRNPLVVNVDEWSSGNARDSKVKILVNVDVEKWIQIHEVFVF